MKHIHPTRSIVVLALVTLAGRYKPGGKWC